VVARERYAACCEFFNLARFWGKSHRQAIGLASTMEARLFDDERDARKNASFSCGGNRRKHGDAS
jgi:hypothetical protein